VSVQIAATYHLKFNKESKGKLAQLWAGLRALPDLGTREAALIADAGRRGMALNFEREAGPDGKRWAPLAGQTQEERRAGIDGRGVPFRVGAAHPILVRTRDLKLSFTDPRHPRNVTDVTTRGGQTTIILGATDPADLEGRIAQLHDGTRRIPARPWIGLNDQARDWVGSQAARVIMQRVERL